MRLTKNSSDQNAASRRQNIGFQRNPSFQLVETDFLTSGEVSFVQSFSLKWKPSLILVYIYIYIFVYIYIYTYIYIYITYILDVRPIFKEIQYVNWRKLIFWLVETIFFHFLQPFPSIFTAVWQNGRKWLPLARKWVTLVKI